MSATQNEILEAFGVLLATGTPVLLWGDPGTGKTETVERFAVESGFHPETVIASLHDPTDFGGLPVVTDDGVRFAPPVWANRVAAHDGPALVFFDEINTATPSTQNALMKVVLSGIVGELDLGGDVVFVAAANPPSQNSGAWDLSLPLANRFAHLDWPLDAEEYKTGYRSGQWPSPNPVKSDIDPAHLARYRALHLAFVSRRPETLCAPPTGKAAADSRGWPSPRSWDRLVNALASARTNGFSEDSNVFMHLAVSLIGEGTGLEFVTYLRDVDLPDPEDLIADPDSFVLPGRADQVHAVLEAVVGAVSMRNTKKRWEAGYRVLIAASQQGAPDIAGAAVHTMAAIVPEGASFAQPGHETFIDLIVDATAGLDGDHDGDEF